jgi:hypothetical protein
VKIFVSHAKKKFLVMKIVFLSHAKKKFSHAKIILVVQNFFSHAVILLPSEISSDRNSWKIPNLINTPDIILKFLKLMKFLEKSKSY